MLFTVRPCPLCLPQPLLWPRRPGSGHGSHVGGGGSGQGRAGEVVVGALVSILLVPVVGLAAVLLLLLVASGAALMLLLIVVKSSLFFTSDKEAFLCIRLRMTPQYSIDRSQRTVHNS